MKKKAVEYTIKATKQEFAIEKITSAEDAQKYAKNFYYDDISIYESSFILLINQANNVMGYAKISQGGIVGTTVDVRIIAKYAIDVLATAVILVHNHPSGNIRPSLQDDRLTESVKNGLNLLNVKLLDHIIITDGEQYYSYTDESRL